jgi:SAM-dependent methyltransferase
MQRRVIAELLDDDLGSPEEIASSLRDLRHINAWFGGTRTTKLLLRKVAERTGVKELSLLEIGSGAGDVPLSAKRSLINDGISVNVTLLDRRCTHLPANSTPSVCSDAMRLPFRESTFDVVSCSLFAHHFDPEQLRLLAAEALRVSRRAVLINDLIRSRLHLLLVYFGLPLFRSRITWHDAPASVRAAYTVPEMTAILTALPLRPPSVSRHLLFRMGVILSK